MNTAEYIKNKKMKEVKERDNNIRKLYKNGYSMNELVLILNHSKHTIFRAIHAQRSKK